MFVDIVDVCWVLGCRHFLHFFNIPNTSQYNINWIHLPTSILIPNIGVFVELYEYSMNMQYIYICNICMSVWITGPLLGSEASTKTSA